MPESAIQVAVSPPGPKALPEKAPEDAVRWKLVMGLPCSASVEVPMAAFTVKDLLGLKPQAVIGSQWLTTANLPLRVNRELIAWCEFEVLGNRVAVRLTELA